MNDPGVHPITVGDLHVEVRGEGPPVLLIHGNAGDLHYFDVIAPALARHFRVLAMDCRGQGLSARGDGALTIGRMAEDAADVIRAVVGDEPCAVIGFSDGANVAMVLAARYPHLIRSLVLNAGNIDPSGLLIGLRIHLQLTDAVQRLRRPTPTMLRRRELTRLMLDPPGITPADLRTIRVPTLVLAGSHDVVRRAHTRRIAQAIPGAQLRIIPHGTHQVLRLMPELADKVITPFLRTGG